MRRPARAKRPAARLGGVMTSRSGETGPRATFGATSRRRGCRSRCRSSRCIFRPGSAWRLKPAGATCACTSRGGGSRARSTSRWAWNATDCAKGIAWPCSSTARRCSTTPRENPRAMRWGSRPTAPRDEDPTHPGPATPARGRGLGAALRRAAEATARECGKTLLVLDTASDEAERLYERLGWVRVGVIPGYALLPQGGLCGTTVYYRNLGG